MDSEPNRHEKPESPGVTAPYPCDSCGLDTPHRTHGTMPHPRNPLKTARLLECTVCRGTVVIAGPDTQLPDA